MADSYLEVKTKTRCDFLADTLDMYVHVCVRVRVNFGMVKVVEKSVSKHYLSVSLPGADCLSVVCVQDGSIHTRHGI